MRAFSLLCCACLAACVTVRSLQIEPIDPAGEQPIVVVSPVKVHLNDGSTVVFSKGIRVVANEVIGDGLRYNAILKLEETVAAIPLDEVAAMETFQTPVDAGATAVASTGATVGGGLGGLAILKAVFGSCPTTYSLGDGEPVLEAESFSYSIAPGFEMRDIDRLGFESMAAEIELEMRNEALETHYINQVELLAVEHAPGQSVYPDQRQRPLVVTDLRPPVAAVDSNGTRLESTLAAADGIAARTDAARLDEIDIDDFEDHVDLTFDVEPGSDNVLVLRLRNSLLNTVLLYDIMLAGQGLAALDWMGSDLTTLLGRYRLASWYRQNMGMKVSAWRGGRLTQIAAIDDAGPIAWKEIAVQLPESRESRQTVRLSFVSDNWRIDRAAVARLVRKSVYREVPLIRVRDRFDAVHETARENLNADDERYVITRPGDFLRLRFDAGPLPDDARRTYFLAATGYYIEWLRADWLRNSASGPFRPEDAAIVAAIESWREQRDELRARFDASRINVR